MVLGSNTVNTNTELVGLGFSPIWFVLCKIDTLAQNTANQVFNIPHTNIGTQIDGPNSSKITPYYHIIKPFKYFRFIVTESQNGSSMQI